MFDVNELEREYRGFINQLRNEKNENSIPIKISEAKIEETNKNIKILLEQNLMLQEKVRSLENKVSNLEQNNNPTIKR